MRRITLLLLVFFFTLHVFATNNERSSNYRFDNDDFTVVYPEIIVMNVPQDIVFKLNKNAFYKLGNSDSILVMVNDKACKVPFLDGEARLSYSFPKKEEVQFCIGTYEASADFNPIPLWFSILPPLIAIIMALVFREVFSALFTGILFGTTIIHYYQGSNLFKAFFQGIFSISDTYLLNSLFDKGHLSIIVFSMMIGAVVTLITRNGGMKGVVNRLTHFAKNRSSGQFVTWLLGIAIFFDDYANTLVVGNTMRPVTDRLKISREKLAYIVDSTAAPVASIAFITTWIGAELSYIQDGIDVIGLNESSYNIFLNSLSYSFYPIFSLVFLLLIIFLKRDFGPMYKAEMRMIKEGIRDDEATDETMDFVAADLKRNVRPKARNALLPILTIVFGTLAGLFFTGFDAELWNNADTTFTSKLSGIIGASDSYTALLWSSLAGILVALALTLSQQLLSLEDAVLSLVKGFKTMLTAILILVLAWSIALITEHLHTAAFISQILVSFQISPYLVPALTFVMAALVAFSTGTSWGTMAIIYPLILPASWMITQEFQLSYDDSMLIFYNVVSTVLAGAVLGDHCSPISDTTILSSLASSCNHIDHVRTQLPYAISVGLISIGIGTIPAAYGIPFWVLFPFGSILLTLIIFVFGKKVPIGDRCE